LWGGLLVGAAVLAATITLIVLKKHGVLAPGGGSTTPIPYFQRERNTTAAFAADLHPWLLPKELTALGTSPSADVIVVGAGVAGLRAAQVLAVNMSVLILEARVRLYCYLLQRVVVSYVE
jgi:NADPH-dependent 2,4-dienoyl-CoA reductase/sulfur reductase-like enzyme